MWGQLFLSVYLDSSNLEEMLSGLWVLSTSVGGTGSFSAPTVTHSMSESAHKTQTFLAKLYKIEKSLCEYLTQLTFSCKMSMT